MAEKVELSLVESAPHRAAYDLAVMIAKAEGKVTSAGNVTGDRKYWLELYAQCLSAMHPKSPPLNFSDEALNAI